MNIRRQIHKGEHGEMHTRWAKILLCFLVLASGRVVVGMDGLTPEDLARVRSAKEDKRHRYDIERLSDAADDIVKLARKYKNKEIIQLLALEMIYGHVTRMMELLDYDSSYKEKFR